MARSSRFGVGCRLEDGRDASAGGRTWTSRPGCASLGLEHYEQAFRDNDVDAEVLPELTDDDLRELGVCRSATAASCSRRSRAPARRPPAAGRRRGRPSGAGPRAARPPPAGRAAAAHGDVRRPGRLDGALRPARPRGDAARSSAPTRTRSRARSRASRATSPSSWATACWPTSAGPGRTRTTPSGPSGPGSAIVGGRRRPAPRPAATPLAARVGIATGLVVVGDLVGEGAAREEAVVGETPEPRRPAAGAGRAGQRWWSPRRTRRLLGGAVRAAPTSGPSRLKGFAEPVRGVRGSLGERPVGEPLRGAPRRAGRRRWSAATRSWRCCSTAGGRPRPARARSCCSSARPGIGKSRLVRALLRRARRPSRTPALRYQCSPYHTGSRALAGDPPAAPAAGLEPDDATERQLDKLEALLRARGRRRRPTWRRCSPTCSGSTPGGRYPPLRLTPQQRRARTLGGPGRAAPGARRAASRCCCVLEDAHWIDPTTLELVEQALDRIAARARCSLLRHHAGRTTSRPWAGTRT